MAKAARRLAVSQPVVSRAIAELERESGCSPSYRTPQGVEPTIYGRTVLIEAVAVFDELREASRILGSCWILWRGELRIGSNHAIGGGLLPAVLDRLSSQRPRIVFRVKLGDEVMLHYHDLRERNVDLLLGRVLEPKRG